MYDYRVASPNWIEKKKIFVLFRVYDILVYPPKFAVFVDPTRYGQETLNFEISGYHVKANI